MLIRIQLEQLESAANVLANLKADVMTIGVRLEELNRALDSAWSGNARSSFEGTFGHWGRQWAQRGVALSTIADSLNRVVADYRGLEDRLALGYAQTERRSGRVPGLARQVGQGAGPEPGPAPEPPGIVSVQTRWVQKQTGVGYSTWSSKTMLPGMQQPEIFIGIPPTIDLGVYKFAVPPEYQYALVDGQVETRFVYVWGRWESRETTVTSDGHDRTVTERVIERRPRYVMQQYQEVRLVDPQGNVLMVNRSGPLLEGPPGNLP